MIDQVSVFLENQKGRLAAATQAIADAGINMHSLYVADTAEYGVVRLLCDEPQTAAKKLFDAGWRATATPVVAVRIPDEVGSLARLLAVLDESNINLEYAYCISTDGGHAVDVLKVTDTAGVEETLSAAGFEPLTSKDLYIAE